MLEQQAVEKSENAAPQLGVETKSAVAPVAQEIVDIATELEIVRQERDNYKKGLLKAKSKLNDFDSEEDLESKIASIVEKQITERRNIELENKEKELLEKVIKENRELKIAMQNRSQISSGVGQGASSGIMGEVKENYFTPEQLAYFEKRKIDPEKVKQNILKNQK